MKTLIRYFIFLSSLLILTPAQSKACVYFEYGEDVRISLFRLMNDRMLAYSPFVYTSHLFNETISKSHKDLKRNLNEWKSALKADFRDEDMTVVLYKTPPDLFSTLYYKNQLSVFFEGNEFVKVLNKPENRDYLWYLVVCKAIEYWELEFSDPWKDYNSGEMRHHELLASKIKKEILMQLEKNKLDFFTSRYAFQLVRMLFQTSDYKGCVQAYEKHFTDHDTSSVVNPWALHYCAISQGLTGDSIEANYRKSLAFGQSDDKKFRMYTTFDKSRHVVEQTMLLAKNNHEKANILAMTIMNYPGQALETLNQIAMLDPQNEMLQFLLMREVNKLEDWVLTPELSFSPPSVNMASWDSVTDTYTYVNYMKDRNYMQKVIAFVSSIRSRSAGETAQYYSLMLAHLYTMADNTSAALQLLPQTENERNGHYANQALIEELMILSSQSHFSNIANRNRAGLLMDKMEKSVRAGKMESHTFYSMCKRFSKAFMAMNDLPRCILMLDKADNYQWDFQWYEQYDSLAYSYGYYFYSDIIRHLNQSASSKDMIDFITLTENKNKGAMDIFLTSQRLPGTAQSRELLGSIYFREGRMLDALDTWKKLPQDFWTRYEGFRNYLGKNVFRPKPIYPESNSRLRLRPQINKYKMLSNILRIQDSALHAVSDRYKYVLQLAHAWYNVSYFGNSWGLAHYENSCNVFESYEYGFEGIPSRVDNDSSEYHQLKTSKSLYRQVIDGSPDPEQRCEAMAMLQLIAYEECGTVGFHHFPYADEKTYVPIFTKAMWKKYENTRMYKRLNKRCSYFRDFLKKAK